MKAEYLPFILSGNTAAIALDKVHNECTHSHVVNKEVTISIKMVSCKLKKDEFYDDFFK